MAATLPPKPPITEIYGLRVRTHKSYEGLQKADGDLTEPMNYERLAILGAEVLSLSVTQKFYADPALWRKGMMTVRVKASKISNSHL